MNTETEKCQTPDQEINEEVEETTKIEAEEKEDVENLSDLTRKKQAEKEFWAENNMAQTQIFINSMDGNLNFGYKQSTEKFEPKKHVKTYDLKNQDECSEFVETYKDSEYLAVALILCTFEAVVIGDLPELKSKMLECLPVTESEDCDGNETLKQNPYLSMNTILGVIGGNRFITRDGQKCIGLGEPSEKALGNMMEQFPVLKDSIVLWLIQLSNNYKYRTTFDAYQIATAFARIIALDMNDAKKRIFPQMYSDPGNAELLGTLLYILYQDVGQRKEVENILLQLMRSDGKWFWKSVCMTYLFLLENNYEFIDKEELKKTIRKNIRSFQWWDWVYVRELLFRSKYIRTLFAEIFGDAYAAAGDKDTQQLWAKMYINLVRRCYYKVNSRLVELPLVACDTKWQQMCISHVIGKVMSNYHLRKQLFFILEGYLKELSSYNYSEIIIGHISAYLFNMASVAPEYRQDISYFLRRCQNKAAGQIYKRLCCAYDKKGELSVHE